MKHTSLPLENLRSWAVLNNVKLFGADVAPCILTENGSSKGGGLLATSAHDAGAPLLAVPSELILSKGHVEQYAKTDSHFSDLLEAAGPLAQSPRGAIVLFLVYHLTLNSPDGQSQGLGVPNPFTDYVKFLPKDILLPTFYTPEEREMLVGTSLAEALDQKLSSLSKEYDTLKEATEQLPWCQRLWWDDADEGASLTLDDWKLADALYRSRALEIPKGQDVGMVPIVDMANHASDDRWNARFDMIDEEGGAFLLVVRDERSMAPGEEITIRYGVGGACEMIFSYGFLEKQASNAREIFLSLSIPADDPLRLAKIHFAQEAPGVRVFTDEAGHVRWDSTFVWWACVNQEDGLDFQVAQTVDGDRDLKALWKQSELRAEDLPAKLLEDELHHVFALRAVVLIQQRIEAQALELAAGDAKVDHGTPSANVREDVWKTVGRLRKLERELLMAAYETLENEKATLLESAVVRRYLEDLAPQLADTTGHTPDDFA